MASKTSPEHIREYERAETRLLLATAKPSFDEKQLAEISQFAVQVEDWDIVAETAVRKFSAPYLDRAINLAGLDIVPHDAANRIRSFSEQTKFRTLKIAAAQIAFHKTCIEPTGARHSYVKGLALCLQFNGEFGDRFSRDIDVLVEEEQFGRVIDEAVKSGYRVILTTAPLKYVKTSADLQFVVQFSTDVGLMSPDGVLIEVHRRLDKKDIIFDVEKALDSRQAVTLSGVEMQTLEPNLHFTYVCYHHSRHLWSHLHWLADLDLMLRSDRLNSEKLHCTARSIGLSPTVNAAQRMHKILSRSDAWSAPMERPGLEYDFIHACLLNLYGDVELEHKLREQSFGHDLMSKSQITQEKLKQTKNAAWKAKFHPSLSQYLKHPLPSSFFWLYRVQRALIEGRRLFIRDDHTIPSVDHSKVVSRYSQREQKKNDPKT